MVGGRFAALISAKLYHLRAVARLALYRTDYLQIFFHEG